MTRVKDHMGYKITYGKRSLSLHTHTHTHNIPSSELLLLELSDSCGLVGIATDTHDKEDLQQQHTSLTPFVMAALDVCFNTAVS